MGEEPPVGKVQKRFEGGRGPGEKLNIGHTGESALLDPVHHQDKKMVVCNGEQTPP